MIREPFKNVKYNIKSRRAPLHTRKPVLSLSNDLEIIFRKFKSAMAENDVEKAIRISYKIGRYYTLILYQMSDHDNFKNYNILKEIVKILGPHIKLHRNISFLVDEINYAIKEYEKRLHYLDLLKRYNGSFDAQIELIDFVLIKFSEEIKIREEFFGDNDTLPPSDLIVVFEKINDYCKDCPKTVKAAIYFEAMKFCINKKYTNRTQLDEVYGSLLGNIVQVLFQKYTSEESRVLKEIIKKLPPKIKLDIAKILRQLKDSTDRPN